MDKERIQKLSVEIAKCICDLYESCVRSGETDCHKCYLESITYKQLAKALIQHHQAESSVFVPLKNGDIAWGIRNFHGHFKPVKGYISNATIQKDLRVLYEIKYVCRGYFGEKIFKAKEDAEAEIAKMEKNKNVSR